MPRIRGSAELPIDGSPWGRIDPTGFVLGHRIQGEMAHSARFDIRERGLLVAQTLGAVGKASTMSTPTEAQGLRSRLRRCEVGQAPEGRQNLAQGAARPERSRRASPGTRKRKNRKPRRGERNVLWHDVRDLYDSGAIFRLGWCSLRSPDSRVHLESHCAQHSGAVSPLRGFFYVPLPTPGSRPGLSSAAPPGLRAT